MAEILAQGYEELLAENARLKSVQPVGQRATLFIVSVVVLAIGTVISIIAVTVVRPTQDNTSIIAAIMGVTVPILTALLAGAVQQVHLAVNSRLSQLLELTAQASKARGALSERDRTAAQADDAGEQRVVLQATADDINKTVHGIVALRRATDSPVPPVPVVATPDVPDPGPVMDRRPL